MNAKTHKNVIFRDLSSTGYAWEALPDGPTHLRGWVCDGSITDAIEIARRFRAAGWTIEVTTPDAVGASEVEAA